MKRQATADETSGGDLQKISARFAERQAAIGGSPGGDWQVAESRTIKKHAKFYKIWRKSRISKTSGPIYI